MQTNNEVTTVDAVVGNEDELPIRMLVSGEFYSQIWPMMTPEERASRHRSIRKRGYNRILVTRETDAAGKHVIIKGNRTWQVLLDYCSIVKVRYDDAPLEDVPYEHLCCNRRKRTTARNIVAMIPFLEDWYDRHIISLRANPDKTEKIEKDTRKWLAEFFTSMGTPIGESNIDKLKYIGKHAPALLDTMDGPSNRINSIHKLTQKKVNGETEAVPAEENGIPAAPAAIQPADEEGCNCPQPEGTIKLCAPCFASWVKFNEINKIKPVDDTDDDTEEGEEDEDVEQ